METQSTDYPNTPDGSRCVTSTPRFYTSVMKLGSRNPLLLADAGRTDDPFEYQVVCIDRFGVDGQRELAESGVTDYITIPWMFEGLGFDPPLEQKKDAMKRFAGAYIHSGWQQ